jgi:uncharacterized coiled-coil protein SlyX
MENKSIKELSSKIRQHVTLSDKALTLLDALVTKFSSSRSGLIEMSIVLFAQQHMTPTELKHLESSK